MLNLVVFLLSSCDIDLAPRDLIPTVTTVASSSVTSSKATVGLTIVNISAVTEVGFLYSKTVQNPISTNGIKVKAPVVKENNSSLDITGLQPGTKYYYRAYASDGSEYVYGNVSNFTTLALKVPTLTTNTVTNITDSTATCGGTITSNGGAIITVSGVCWSTSANPTIANSKTTDGSASGSFTSVLTGLTLDLNYYVRAYATNSFGTAYGDQLRFASLASSGTVTDIDGNVYHTITIGTQTWMVENLKTTKYNDGTSIPNVTDGAAWGGLTTPGYCFYNNDAANKSTYGALYIWYTVNTGKLAPYGWHVATNVEWTTLENHLIANGYNYDGTTTGNKIAKSLAATTGWNTSTSTGVIGNDLAKNNSSGFTALPSGYRYLDGTFYSVGNCGYWWSSTEVDASMAWYEGLDYSYNYLIRIGSTKSYGFSVRCVRN